MTVLPWPSYERALAMADRLHRAAVYLSRRFRVDMTREEAQANVDARCLLIRAEIEIVQQTELKERQKWQRPQ